uniref:Uncharacterized protein n=1 Tax=viral metagenome TaxID=1070528 RepID=A0A6M3LWU2_9ZZZZ
MPNQDWEKVKEALKKAPTEEARKEAAEAFRRYQVVSLAQGRRSRPTLVSLGLDKPYPTAIEIKDISGEIERNPAFFEHMREIVEED